MSGTGNCFDNAPMESFWGIIKQELINHRHYRTRREAIEVVSNVNNVNESLILRLLTINKNYTILYSILFNTYTYYKERLSITANSWLPVFRQSSIST
jgi:transposase InsO family protein